MNKLNRTLASVGLAVALIGGAVPAAQIATAAPAQAASQEEIRERYGLKKPRWHCVGLGICSTQTYCIKKITKPSFNDVARYCGFKWRY